MPGGVAGWSWSPDQGARKLFMQFLAELKACGSFDDVRIVARQFHTLAEIQWRQSTASELQQPNEGPE